MKRLHAIQEYSLVLQHELVACLRDWRLFASSFLGPLLLVTFAFLFGMMQNYEEKCKPRVAIDNKGPSGAARQELIAQIRRSTELQIVESQSPWKELQEQHLEAVVSFPVHDRELKVSMRGAGWSKEAADALIAELRRIRNDTLAHTYTRPELQRALAVNPLTAEEHNIHQSTAVDSYIAVGLAAWVFLRLAVSMSHLAQSIWLDEVRSGSLLTVQLLPVNRVAFICAKSTAMISLTFARLLMDVLCFAGAIVGLALLLFLTRTSTPTTQSAMYSAQSQITSLPWHQFIPLFCVSCALFVSLYSSVILYVVSRLKQNQVRMALLVSSLLISSPMLLAFGAAPPTFWVHIPMLNLILMLKNCLRGTLTSIDVLIVLSETLVLTVLITMLGFRYMQREQFVLKDA